MSSAHNQKKAYAFGLGAVLAWSTVASAFKLSLQYLSPMQLVLYASAASLLSLLSILAWQGRLPELAAFRRHWKSSLLLGAVNPFAYYLVLFQAYSLLPAQEAQAINYTWALTMTLLAVPLLKQKLRLQDAMAALVCYLGVLVIGTRGQLLELHFSNQLGVLLALASTLLWAGYWIFNTRDTREPVLGLALNFASSLPLSLAWCAWHGQLTPPAWEGLAGAAYVGALEMGFTFVLWLSAMKLTRSTASIANLIFLSPMASLLLIYLIVGEAILPSTLLGLALILGGLLAQKLPLRRVQPQPLANPPS
ncbi:DMT family transporter [Chromobacterium violaceum]|uniref:DMT family transporter n=1 Tax=Chromobacterium violaceum TaxID=536 RepID=UPI0009D9D228|nr:DMT family transporter [Chromobacterium violaceum]OQS48654.1 EamA family transporter [Chromobacterium violaceum]OQS52159.1 EamA family transporter [Chromobacterium violaceum]QRO33088.1 DMT family transporter [Chromobacterium violaceum]QRQ17111.1 DMT family transporter [Chromobacterium violaceum]